MKRLAQFGGVPTNLHKPVLWQLGDVLITAELGVIIMHCNDFVVLQVTKYNSLCCDKAGHCICSTYKTTCVLIEVSKPLAFKAVWDHRKEMQSQRPPAPPGQSSALRQSASRAGSTAARQAPEHVMKMSVPRSTSLQSCTQC